MTNNYVQHTGVIGMKWGVNRAASKTRSNVRLMKKALAYDVKSDRLSKKSEQQHTKNDLEGANKMAKKSANYSIKSSKIARSANKTQDEYKRLKMESRSDTLAYKAAKAKMKANQISKTKGYGLKAMKYSIKSDRVAIKAALARKKITNNKKYAEMMNRKLSSLSAEKRAKVEEDWFGVDKQIINDALGSLRNPKVEYINDRRVRVDKDGNKYVSLY